MRVVVRAQRILTRRQEDEAYRREAESFPGLGGRTPAEAAGIKVEGENKWLTLIRTQAMPRRKRDGKKEID